MIHRPKAPVKERFVKRRGFTLLEILIVVGLIALLSGLLVMAVTKLQTNSKRQQTQALLENCRAMFAEYDAATHVHYDTFITPALGDVSLETERNFEQTTPGYGGDRVGRYVGYTRSMYAQMESIPNIHAAIDKFPGNRMFLTSAVVDAGSPVVFGAVTYSTNTSYPPLATVQFTDAISSQQALFVCIHQDPAKAATPSPPNLAYWIPITFDTSIPILLDAWGNPIICAFGGQFGTGAALNADGSIPYYNFGAQNPSGIIRAGGRSVVVSAPDKRLFFASAGPDGTFAQGDDNLYSFERN